MKIQRIRDSHEVYMGGITYQFRDENDRICEVTEKSHQDRFLLCPLDYREVLDKPVVKASSQETPPQDSAVESPKIKPMRRPRQPRQRFSPEIRPGLVAD